MSQADLVRQKQVYVNPELKVPPHSVEAEQAVLGGLMLNNNAWNKVADRLTENDFYRLDHRVIFRAMADLVSQSKPIDIIIVSEILEGSHELEMAGGLPYLGGLAKNTPTSANIAAYADIVRERATLRRLIELGGEVIESAFKTDGRSSQELLQLLKTSADKIAPPSGMAEGPVVVGNILDVVLGKVGERYDSPSSASGESTGIHKLDELTGGLQDGELIIIAARPSMGKTALALNIAWTIASKDKPVLIFSKEMAAEKLIERILSFISGVDSQIVMKRSNLLDEKSWSALCTAASEMHSKKILIDDRSNTISQIENYSRQMTSTHGKMGVIIIDYLQLFDSDSRKSFEHRSSEVSHISRRLKLLATELNAPVMALSQLNRNIESRNCRRPLLSDLRESGGIEQDADLILFIWKAGDEESPEGITEITIGKQRNGPVGDFTLRFNKSLTIFENV